VVQWKAGVIARLVAKGGIRVILIALLRELQGLTDMQVDAQDL